MLSKALGWFAVLLLLIGIVRSVPMSGDRSIARASTPPAVATIDPELSAGKLIVDNLPVYEWVERIPSLEERVSVVESRADDHKSIIDSLITKQTETVELLGQLHRLVLSELKQSAAPPLVITHTINANGTQQATSNQPQNAPTIDPPAALQPEQLPRKLFWFGAEWCQPCKQWREGPEAERIIADGCCELVPVNVDDIPDGSPRPNQVPYYELHIGGKFARHPGPLTYRKFKDMERAVLEALRGAK